MNKLEQYHKSPSGAMSFIIRGNFEAGNWYILTTKDGKTYGRGRFSYDMGGQYPRRISLICWDENLAKDIKRNEGVQMTLELEYRERNVKNEQTGEWTKDISVIILNAFIPFPKDSRPKENDELFDELPWETPSNGVVW